MILGLYSNQLTLEDIDSDPKLVSLTLGHSVVALNQLNGLNGHPPEVLIIPHLLHKTNCEDEEIVGVLVRHI